jgi:hypothetical protein
VRELVELPPALEGRFVYLFKATAGRVYVAWSAQNIDRTVTLYRACLKAGRTLVVDLYTAEVLDALASFGRIPNPAGAISKGAKRRISDCNELSWRFAECRFDRRPLRGSSIGVGAQRK